MLLSVQIIWTMVFTEIIATFYCTALYNIHINALYIIGKFFLHP